MEQNIIKALAVGRNSGWFPLIFLTKMEETKEYQFRNRDNRSNLKLTNILGEYHQKGAPRKMWPAPAQKEENQS